MITDAQFAQWLAGNGPVTVLCEIDFAYQTSVGPAVGTVYLSSRKFTSGTSDVPQNTAYKDVIKASPDFQRAIDVKKLGGRWTMTAGNLTLDNANGVVDYFLDGIFDGREIRTYFGDSSWARSDFRLASTSIFVAANASSVTQMQVQVRDKTYLLDDTIIGDAIATGPNIGKPKPILMGIVKNFDITPYMLDSSALTYYIANGAFDSVVYSILGPAGSVIDNVRDAGLSLFTAGLFTFTAVTMTANASTDTLTYSSPHNLVADDVIIFQQTSAGSFFTGLSFATQYWVVASGLTVNNFELSTTRGGTPVDITGTVMSSGVQLNRQRFYLDTTAGTIQLSSAPQGRVTVDIQVADIAGGLPTTLTPHDVFGYVLSKYSKLATTEFDSTAIAALATAEYAGGGALVAVQYGRSILDRVNVVDILDDIAAGSYSWYGWTSAGVLTVGRLDLSNIDTVAPIAAISTDDLVGDPSYENLQLPWGKVILNGDRNTVIQTDGLLNTVTAANRSLWSQQFQTRVETTDPALTDYLSEWWSYHKSAIDSKPIETWMMGYAPGGLPRLGLQAACDAITALFKPWTRVFTGTVGLEFYALNPGDCVSVTFPRYGLSNGKNFRVASVKPRLVDRAVDLVLVTQVTPDYTSTSH